MVELTRDHVRYALGVARRIPHPDPVMRESDALFALLKASRTYDPDVGGTFRGYAAQRVTWAVQDGLRVADHLSRSRRREVSAGADDGGPPASLDALMAMDEDANGPLNPLLWAAPDPDPDVETQISVQDALAALDTRGGLVVRMRFHDWTGLEIGAFLGVSESRACQLYRDGLNELRAVLGIDSSAEMLAA